MKIAKLVGSIAAALIATFCCQSWGQSVYPDRPVRVVVGVAPGHTTDILARMLATSLTKSLGQSFFVENKLSDHGSCRTVHPDIAMPEPQDGS